MRLRGRMRRLAEEAQRRGLDDAAALPAGTARAGTCWCRPGGCPTERSSREASGRWPVKPAARWPSSSLRWSRRAAALASEEDNERMRRRAASDAWSGTAASTAGDGSGRRLRLSAAAATHGVCWPGLAQAAQAMRHDPAAGNRRRFLDAVREAVGQLQARGLWPGGCLPVPRPGDQP